MIVNQLRNAKPTRAQDTAGRPAPHAQEVARLAALRRLGILDTHEEERYDRITRLVARVLDIETVLISLVDENRQWFKSVCNLGVRQTARDVAFCAHAINDPSDQLVVPDATRDPVFANNPLVTGAPNIRCYAGVVLRGAEGLPLGTLCAIGYAPREFSPEFLESLRDFGAIVEREISRDITTADPEAAPVGLDGASSLRLVNTRETEISSRLSLIMSLRDEAAVLASVLRVARVDSLAKAYGNAIVDELLDEVKRRIFLAVQGFPHHLVVTARGEFALRVALPLAEVQEDPMQFLAKALSYNLGEKIQTSRVTLATPIRIGISQPAGPRCSANDLLSCAEVACERTSSVIGGPACAFYESSMGIEAGRHQVLLVAAGLALDRGELTMELQPKIDSRSRHIVGAEALVRWAHPSLGAVSPTELLQALADLDRLPEFDMWMLDAVCSQLRMWAMAGQRVLPVAVNICGATLLEGNFPQRAREILRRHNIAPKQIELEILESVVIEDMEHAVAQIERCRELGFAVSLDDFGAGQTALTYLKNLPVQAVKIDQSFVKDMVSDVIAAQLVMQIIALCKTLGKTVIVEGVETASQYLLLRSFGCDSMQGYYLSRPMAVGAFDAVLANDAPLRLADSEGSANGIGQL